MNNIIAMIALNEVKQLLIALAAPGINSLAINDNYSHHNQF